MHRSQRYASSSSISASGSAAAQQLSLAGVGEENLGLTERYRVSKNARELIREICLRGEIVGSSSVRTTSTFKGNIDLGELFDYSWLRSAIQPDCRSTGELRVADLFCGCGGLTLGVFEAARALGYSIKSVCAADTNKSALETYTNNFPSEFPLSAPIETAINGGIGSRSTRSEKDFLTRVGRIDLLVGGPPCQGHSDLNNHTRRSDPRNALVLRIARLAEISRPVSVIIENVQGIRHDKSASLEQARELLVRLGYKVDEGLIEATSIGVPQRRRRYVLVASLNHQPNLSNTTSIFSKPTRSVQWACDDLMDYQGESDFDTSAKHSPINQERIRYLFDNGLYELPDEMRPNCHKLKAHSYKSVYGRMKWDAPAPTITTGFGSTGQGRFVHPLRMRTLTPHEAARIQFFPDFFKFARDGRRNLQELIGNAVPSKLAYALALPLIARDMGNLNLDVGR